MQAQHLYPDVCPPHHLAPHHSVPHDPSHIESTSYYKRTSLCDNQCDSQCDCDHCLLSAMRAADLAERQRGWEAWYQRDQRALASYLARRCHTVGIPEQGEDLLHDCFVIGFRKIVSGAYVDQGRSLRAYLYGIAKNLVREASHLRRREVPAEALHGQELAIVTRTNALSLDDLLYLHDVVALVQEARHRQPPLQQNVLYGLYAEGKSSLEVALEVRQSAGNTRIIALRAVNEIQRYLEQHHHTQISSGAIRSCLSLALG